VPPKSAKFQKNQGEPMDIDQSIQSRNVNYQNFQSKRSTQQSGNQKIQPLFNLDQPEEEDEEEPRDIFFDAESDEDLEINFLDWNRFRSLKSKEKTKKVFKFLLDTGASISAIKPEHTVKKFLKKQKPFIVKTLHGQSEISEFIEAPLLKSFGIFENIKFFVVPILRQYDGILGHSAIKQLNLVLNFKNNTVSNGKVKFNFFYFIYSYDHLW
jgi:Retroviral aspartyl protease